MSSFFFQPAARETLLHKAQWLRLHPDARVVIAGHTDEGGSRQYNLALGDRRAGAVKSFLIRQGIERERLIAVSYGKERALGGGGTEAARAKNRCVTFHLEE